MLTWTSFNATASLSVLRFGQKLPLRTDAEPVKLTILGTSTGRNSVELNHCFRYKLKIPVSTFKERVLSPNLEYVR
jgi:hypothetical protein